MATTNYNGKTVQELAAYTDSIRITHEDLTASASNQTITKAVKAGQQVRGVAYKLHTQFAGHGATLKLDVGDTNDDDGYIDNHEIHASGTTLDFGPAGTAAPALAGIVYATDTNINIKFTINTGNVSQLTSGEVEIFFNIVGLNDISTDFAS
tara:strand:- start:713 stop:1168 length:456 start_codon:yes stop_codon:yes gene_type:complete